MTEYDNRNTGALFKNERKEKDNQPDYTGSWTDGSGKEMQLAAWIRKSKKGQTFMSVRATEKRVQDSKPSINNERAESVDKDDFDDDIPF